MSNLGKRRWADPETGDDLDEYDGSDDIVDEPTFKKFFQSLSLQGPGGDGSAPPAWHNYSDPEEEPEQASGRIERLSEPRLELERRFTKSAYIKQTRQKQKLRDDKAKEDAKAKKDGKPIKDEKPLGPLPTLAEFHQLRDALIRFSQPPFLEAFAPRKVDDAGSDDAGSDDDSRKKDWLLSTVWLEKVLGKWIVDKEGRASSTDKKPTRVFTADVLDHLDVVTRPWVRSLAPRFYKSAYFPNRSFVTGSCFRDFYPLRPESDSRAGRCHEYDETELILKILFPQETAVIRHSESGINQKLDRIDLKKFRKDAGLAAHFSQKAYRLQPLASAPLFHIIQYGNGFNIDANWLHWFMTGDQIRDKETGELHIGPTRLMAVQARNKTRRNLVRAGKTSLLLQFTSESEELPPGYELPKKPQWEQLKKRWRGEPPFPRSDGEDIGRSAPAFT